MIFYLLYRLGHILACLLPIGFSYRIAEFLSYLQYLFAKKDRFAVTENLRLIYDGDIEKARKDSYEVFRSFGLYLVDFFRFSRLSREFIKRNVEIKGIENLNSALKENRGVIALTGHIGNWEMGGVVMAMLGYRISAVALVHSYKRINDFFVRQREDKGLMVIPIGIATKRCISVLKKGGILALLGDRDFSDSGIPINFFGKETFIPKGPALFSLKLKSPIVPGFFIRKSRYRYELIFERPFHPIENDNPQDALVNLTKRALDVLERYIRLYPTQWLMFRHFWETPKDVFIL